MTALGEIARAAREAVRAADGRAFVDAIDASGAALAALGAAADAPIVPAEFAALGAAARLERAAFIPSGAGGGDVGVFVGMEAPSPSFTKKAELASMAHLAFACDVRGVRVIESQGTS
jgi:hypothetical protein